MRCKSQSTEMQQVDPASGRGTRVGNATVTEHCLSAARENRAAGRCRGPHQLPDPADRRAKVALQRSQISPHWRYRKQAVSECSTCMRMDQRVGNTNATRCVDHRQSPGTRYAFRSALLCELGLGRSPSVFTPRPLIGRLRPSGTARTLLLAALLAAKCSSQRSRVRRSSTLVPSCVSPHDRCRWACRRRPAAHASPRCQ